MTTPISDPRPVRIGCVSYLNTRPLVEGIESLEGVELAPTVPSKLIGSLVGGDVDLGLVSVVDAVRAPEALSILPVGMIGSDGPTLTVRLFSDRPIAEVARIHADTDSHTSVELCRLLMRELHGVEVELVPYNARERMPLARAADAEGVDERPDPDRWPEAMLLIGDKVVTDSPPAVRYPHQLDLGEAWREMTGLPFVYAAWMCLAERSADRSVQTAAALLDRQRRHNSSRLDWIASRSARAHRWPADLARTYLGESLVYDLDERALAGLGRFYGLLDCGGDRPTVASLTTYEPRPRSS